MNRPEPVRIPDVIVVHQLGLNIKRTACGLDLTDNTSSAFGTDVTCEPCRQTWRPETRTKIDSIRARLEATT